jgi:prepilin-type processing-associated H-X9-DG protein
MPDIGLSDPANPAVRLRPYRISHIQRSSEVCLIWDAEQVFDLNLFPFSYGNSFPVSDQVDDWGLWQSGPAANLSEVCYYLLMGPGVNGGDAVWTSQQPWLPYYAGVGANGSGNTNRPGSSVYPGPFSAEIQWRHGTNEHVSKANFLFVDGHVETLTLNFGLGSNSNIGINCDLKDRNIYVNPNY